MCDCSEVEDEVDVSIKTITIFQKLANSANPHTECTEEMTECQGRISLDREEIPCLSKTGSPGNEVCPTILTSSEGSTDSARVYKFVNDWELECKCDAGDEGGEFESNRSCSSGNDVDEFEDEAEDIECTLAIIKPSAVAHRNAIERRIVEAGFSIQQTRYLQLTSEQVSEFYCDSYEPPDFAHLVAFMASGPIVAHVLAKKQAIREWRTLMGPKKVSNARLYFPDCIRARYGTNGQDYKNAVHGSANHEEAQREIHFFFPDYFIAESISNWQSKAENYLGQVVNKLVAKGLALCCQEKPEDPITWLASWLLKNNPNTSKL